MKSPIHILHLEDNPKDVELVQCALAAEDIPCVITCVKSRDDFVAALARGNIDLILSDCALPDFDGLAALEIARANWPAIPLIFVSGTLGEERAIDSLKSGATDYVLKERLARLGPAVRRAMQEIEERAEHRRMETQFIEAQKMEVIGHLASGVAHDFNNILFVIMSYNDLIAQGLAQDSPLRAYSEEIRNATDRAAGLTRQLLIFSRKETVQPVVLGLNDVLNDLSKMLRRLIGENIEIVMIPGHGLGGIQADPGHVGQVLMNLVVNARDAMPNGGRLTIATGNATLDEEYARTHPGARPGDYVRLGVSDTGTGMTDDIKAHLFEAFFTTKPKGKGTGLGLATCQAIVQQSGGHIGVDSTLGQGTTFQVYFPRVKQAPEAPAGPIPTGPLPRGTETLLLVEDDPAVRHLAYDVLEGQGYRVLRAGDGQEGLRVTREPGGRAIDLVITDVIMPVMGGKAMVEWLKLNYPDLKVLFTSGYTEDAMLQQGVFSPGVAFLPKPYTPGVLLRKVREMLDAAPEKAPS